MEPWPGRPDVSITTLTGLTMPATGEGAVRHQPGAGTDWIQYRFDPAHTAANP
jgi:hypothetical protein